MLDLTPAILDQYSWGKMTSKQFVMEDGRMEEF